MEYRACETEECESRFKVTDDKSKQKLCQLCQDSIRSENAKNMSKSPGCKKRRNMNGDDPSVYVPKFNGMAGHEVEWYEGYEDDE